jgi:hypothetical protein
MALTAAIVASACTRPSDDLPGAGPAAPTTSSSLPATTLPAPLGAPATLPAPAVTAASTLPEEVPATTGTAGSDRPRPSLAGITMASVPTDVIVPSDAASLNDSHNPINGARGGERPASGDPECEAGTDPACLVPVLDLLGFDVTSGDGDDRDRRVARALAVVQLDAGLDMTGEPDHATLEYLGVRAVRRDARHVPDETRLIGESGEGRAITALRYGNGPRVVLVVGQTHGDEEAGLRVLLRARQQQLPDGVTLWVIPTMNPDGGIADSRLQANGANLNRAAVSEPEQRAVYQFALDVEPTISIWYHQNYGWVGGSGASSAPAQRYQELTGLGTLHRSGDCAKGFMWCPIDDALGASSILVELPDVVTPADVHTHAAALIEVVSDPDL